MALALASPLTARAADPLSSMNAWVEGQLSAHTGSMMAFVFLFFGGWLASLLPCVYPLYPITATIVKGRAKPGGARWPHPLVYFFGMASMYAIFGLIAGVSGGAFNVVLRLPAVNLAIAAVFLLLALATCGLLHFSLLGGGQIGDKTPGLQGTFVMGLGAGLLSSSCVGPFVISILIGIASGDASGGFALGAALTAAAKMLAFGIGLGSTFLIVGLFGARPPKSGMWMKYVQWALAGLIAWFAYVYLEKGLSGCGFESSAIGLIYGATLLMLFAAYRLQPDTVAQSQRMERALLSLLAAISFLTMARAILPGTAAVNAVGVSAGGPEVEQSGQLKWFLNREDALSEAKHSGKPVFVDFYGSWCANCKAFEKLTHSNEALGKALSGVVLLKIRDTSPDFKVWQNDPRFPELKIGLPFFIIIDAAGNLLYKTSDYTRTDEMMLFLEG